MRHLFRENEFDYVFNLFTSFGYFDTESDSFEAIRNACLSLKKGGTLVIDYLNTTYVAEHLVATEEVVVNTIRFHISRNFDGKFFHKHIRFTHHNNDYHFAERVSGFHLDDFNRFLEPNGMVIEKLSGNYDLHPFNEKESPRLIIIAKKT
jgi:hypothetical protein